jgi:hypothetical protein
MVRYMRNAWVEVWVVVFTLVEAGWGCGVVRLWWLFLE